MCDICDSHTYYHTKPNPKFQKYEMKMRNEDEINKVYYLQL